ncbi:MAG TPA: hypothetical protein VHT25_11435 [Solirubrobacteraceae bacterium]|nr:hypothetical protein [Solirubrobacteraceae bacterium]
MRQRVEHVGDGDDASGKWDGLAAETSGISHSVPALVVAARDHRGQLQYWRAAALEQPCAEVRVRLHRLELLGGEPAGLAQDAVVDADLADVVQRSGKAQDGDAIAVPPELCGDLGGRCADAFGVREGVVVAELGRERQSFERFGARVLEVSRALLEVSGPLGDCSLEQCRVLGLAPLGLDQHGLELAAVLDEAADEQSEQDQTPAPAGVADRVEATILILHAPDGDQRDRCHRPEQTAGSAETQGQQHQRQCQQDVGGVDCVTSADQAKRVDRCIEGEGGANRRPSSQP